MGRYVSRYWHPRLDAPLARERRGGRYEAYVPDYLSGWAPRLSLEVMATAGEAEAAVAALNRRYSGSDPHPSDTFVHVLLRVEATASSRIEGIELAPRRLLTAAAEHRGGGGCPCLVVKPRWVGFLGFRVGSGVVGRGFGF